MTMTEFSGTAFSEASGLGTRVVESLAGVARKAGIDPLAVRLLRIKRWLAEDIEELNRSIGVVAEHERVGGEANLAELASQHLLERPGKRVRPLCVILAARMGGRQLDAAVCSAAVACELVHAATLLHDDVLDEGTERRGAAAARMVFGNSVSILAGDHLLVEALKMVERTGAAGLLRDLLETISAMVAAEALQLERRGGFTPDREAYLDVVSGKTAALFRWGLAAGGRLGGLDDASVAALASTGQSLGMAFQLIDDCLDLAGDPELTGKDMLADLREGKMTWPLILANEHDSTIGDLVRDALADEGKLDQKTARQVLERIADTGAVAATRVYAARQAENAREALKTLPDGRPRRAIEAVIKSVIHRSK